MDLTAYDIEAARHRLAAVVSRTPLLASAWLSNLTGAPVFLKLECLQSTGSFKIRGAANKLLSLSPEQRRRGIVACSSGNHGLATATIAEREKLPAAICVPAWVDTHKLRQMRATGAEIVVQGDTVEEAERVSLQLQRERDATYVHPFDDPLVIAGQGTIGQEILEQQPGIDAVLVPTSGGGLVAGIAIGLQRIDPSIRVVAVQAERAAVLAASVRERRLTRLPEEPTLAAALAGNLGNQNRHTLRLVSELVDDWVEVSETAILAAMRGLWQHHRLVAEGGGAVGVAALLQGWAHAPASRVAVVVSGGNIALSEFAQHVEGADEPSVPDGTY